MKRNAVKNKMKCEMEFGFNKAVGLQSAKPLKTNFNVDVSREFLKIFILLNPFANLLNTFANLFQKIL